LGGGAVANIDHWAIDKGTCEGWGLGCTAITATTAGEQKHTAREKDYD
jgi:hypothetical protein